ncbi:hypothetical protein niasHS_017220 [Heterodera schachtii]|uniref:Uncharacterized protein n=2 Tax=Heterodera TaxID=34509 RepID=A0ABD2I272_HETSC
MATDIKTILLRLSSIETLLSNNNNNTLATQMAEQFNAIAERLNEIERKINSNNNDNPSAEEKERKRSLVLIGLSEAVAEKPSERAKEDAETVAEVLDALDVEVCPQMVYRMGRRIDEKRKGPRLVKVVLPATTFQRFALAQWGRNRTELKQRVGWQRLLVRPSLTKEELAAEREIREQRRMNYEESKKTEMVTTRRGGKMEKNF